MEDPQLNFFTLAFERYKLFALPYITAALFFNKKAVAEIITENTRYFTKPKMDFLRKHFPDRFLIRKIPKKFAKWKNGKFLKSIRWLEIPELKTPYVYTGDVDIIILESNIHIPHIEHAKKIGKPYSNLVRKNGINMTGLHFIISDPYYEKMSNTYLNKIISELKTKKVRLKSLDERLLCRMVKERFGLPEGHAFRPIHGLHLSLRHPIVKWAATGVCPPAFNVLIKSAPWIEGMKTVFDTRFKKVIHTYRNQARKLGKEDRALANKILSGKYSKVEVCKLIDRRQVMRSIKISLK